MLPIVDRPLIHTPPTRPAPPGSKLIFVTSRGKTMIADHFDVAYELEANLRERGKMEALANIRDAMPKPGRFSTRQQNLWDSAMRFGAPKLVPTNLSHLLLADD